MRIVAMALGLWLAAYVACEEPAVAVEPSDVVRGGAVVSGNAALFLSLFGDPLPAHSDQVSGRIEVTAIPGVSTAVEVFELELEELSLAAGSWPEGLELREVRVESTAIAWAGGSGESVANVPCVLLAELRTPDQRRLAIELPFEMEVALHFQSGGTAFHVDAIGVGRLETFPIALESMEVSVTLREEYR